MPILIDSGGLPTELANFMQDLVNGGKPDTLKLRKFQMDLLHVYGNSYMEVFEQQTGLYILKCSVCGELVYASTSLSAYNGAQTICEKCSTAYSLCKECNSYILTIDLNNPSHIHITSTRNTLYVDDQEEKTWNADIMSTKPTYYKTLQEFMIWKNQKESYVDTVYKAHTEVPFRYFGVEVEVEKIKNAPPDMITRTYNQFEKQFIIVKHDGSLSNKGKGGFEIVTMPATLAYHKSGAWDKFFDNLGGFFQVAPPTSGIHIHAGLGTITKIVSGKMLIFVNSKQNREFIESIAERTLGVPNPNGKIYANVDSGWKLSDVIKRKHHESHCPWNPKTQAILNRYVMDKSGSVVRDEFGNPIIASIKPGNVLVRPVCKCTDGIYDSTKYEAFNLMTKRPTVELRIFRGIILKEFLFSALEFADALADYCSEVSPNHLNYKDFLAWMTQYNASGKSKLYPNLSRHLINKGWLDPKKSALKPGTLTDIPVGQGPVA